MEEKTLLKTELFKKNDLKNNEMIVNILNKILNKRILRYTYLGNCKLKRIPEYNFSLSEFNIILEDYTNYSVFIKKIKKTQIEETLFCYWQFCEQNYNLHANFYLHKANIRNNDIKINSRIAQKYSMQLLSKNNKIWKVSDISIVELTSEFTKDFAKEYLFIGII